MWRSPLDERILKSQRLFENLRVNPKFPREFILRESWFESTYVGDNFFCRLIRPVKVDGCEISWIGFNFPPGIGEEEIETGLFGPDGRLVYPSELGYDDARVHKSLHDLLDHVCDLAQKLFLVSDQELEEN